MSVSHSFRHSALRFGALLVALALTSGASLPSAHAQVGPFAVGSSFNSTFNGSHTGWSVVTGPWKQGAASYSTIGIVDAWSSINHKGTYTNFVYASKAKRLGGSGGNIMMFVRGNPSGLGSSNLWNTAYNFNADTGTGLFGVNKWVGGVLTAITLQSSAAISSGSNWNILKVVFYGPVYSFYINGTLVYYGYDAALPSGQVGIGGYDPVGSAGDKLVVDWAKLTVIP